MAVLKRQLGLLDVFSVATGAMISSGLFVLPAIAYTKAGPAVILAYLFASILVIPSILSKAELTTAMPKAGGTYFFVERSLGSIWGLFGGLAGWLSLALKGAFAIVGMAVLVEVVLASVFPMELSPWHLKAIAVVCCGVFTALNIVSVKHTSIFQIALVAILLVILGFFVLFGAGTVDAARYKGFLEKGWVAVFATAGMVFVSFGGLTKVASIGEEVKNPGRNLPLGMVLSWFVVTLAYLGVIIITVGAVDGKELGASLTPISLAAGKFAGRGGFVLLSIAAMAAFVTTANGGILAASRAPMAMSRDRLLPPIFSRVNDRYKSPHMAILLTGGFMMVAIILLDLKTLVKTASTLKKIQSYRPRFKSPLYPYIHILAIIAYGALIIDMGKVPLLISAAFVALSVVWFKLYVCRRVGRASAVMHVVERVTDRQLKTVTLENELRDILLARDDIIEDRFDKLIKQCEIVDVKGRTSAEEVFRRISKIMEKRLDVIEYVLFEKFLHREAEGSTVIRPGLAIPHVIVDGEHKFDVLLVRAADGIDFPHAPDPVRTMFVLAGSEDERNYHLRALMAIERILSSVGSLREIRKHYET
jgi:amino acid transporter/mannitol/fructose-specific phosphotransferase system IIA component (Ntr-type)